MRTLYKYFTTAKTWRFNCIIMHQCKKTSAKDRMIQIIAKKIRPGFVFDPRTNIKLCEMS